MSRAQKIYAGAWALAGVLWVVNGLTGLDAAGHSREFYVMAAVFIAVHLLVLIGLVGLVREGVTGDSTWGRWGLYLAIFGRILFVAAEATLLTMGYEDENVVILPIAALSTAIGMLVAGIAAVRARRWDGWRRFAPLVMGIYPFLLMFPILAVTGTRPNLMVSLWGLTFLVIAAAFATARVSEGFRVDPDSGTYLPS